MMIALRREKGGTKKFKGAVNHGQCWLYEKKLLDHQCGLLFVNMHNLFFSQYHLCSIGYESGDDGTKMAGILQGDSGSALQVHENGRLSFYHFH